jgi:hypothetical protein
MRRTPRHGERRSRVCEWLVYVRADAGARAAGVATQHRVVWWLRPGSRARLPLQLLPPSNENPNHRRAVFE